MQISPTTDEQLLRLLNSSDSQHPWSSCDEQRHCILCEKDLPARAVLIQSIGSTRVKLHCPTAGCPGGPETWVRLGNPLVSGQAWDDWERILGDWERAAS